MTLMPRGVLAVPNLKWPFSPDKPSPGFCPPARAAFHTNQHKDKQGYGVYPRQIYIKSFQYEYIYVKNRTIGLSHCEEENLDLFRNNNYQFVQMRCIQKYDY